MAVVLGWVSPGDKPGYKWRFVIGWVEYVPVINVDMNGDLSKVGYRVCPGDISGYKWWFVLGWVEYPAFIYLHRPANGGCPMLSISRG